MVEHLNGSTNWTNRCGKKGEFYYILYIVYGMPSNIMAVHVYPFYRWYVTCAQTNLHYYIVNALWLIKCEFNRAPTCACDWSWLTMQTCYITTFPCENLFERIHPFSSILYLLLNTFSLQSSTDHRPGPGARRIIFEHKINLLRLHHCMSIIRLQFSSIFERTIRRQQPIVQCFWRY